MTALPQGYTNTVQVFDRVMKKILKDQIAAGIGKPFIDDVAVKPASRSTFLDKDEIPEEVAPGIRKYVLEAIILLDKILADIKGAGGTISGKKSEFLKEQIKIVAYVCGIDGRTPEEAKITKIIGWPACTDLTDVRAFLGICVYYRIWIKDFSIIAEPLFKLGRKKEQFIWVEEQEEAMDTLKRALTTAPALKPIDYYAAGTIFLSVDSSNIGWGAILQQEEESTNKRHLACFESEVWNEAEKKYDGGKLECRGLLKALKKLQVYLYGVRFVMEIDARMLLHQLNLLASDLLGLVVNRWLAWIRLFNFDIKHVAGKKHGGPDGLSRRKQSEDDSDDGDDSDELDECMDADLTHAMVNNGDGDNDAENDDMPDELKRIKRYLLTLERPDEMTDKAFRAFVRYTTEFLVNEGLLFRRAKLNMPPRRVSWDRNEQNNIIQQLHDESGHRGKKGTYQKIAL